MNYEVKPFDESEWKKIHEFDKRISTEDTKKLKERGYSAKVFRYEYVDKSKHYWDYLKIIIYKNEEEYFTFYRNYSGTPDLVYVEQNGKEYIITSSDYQCISIINLTDKTMENYCLGEYDKGWGFCPTDIDAWEDDGSLILEVTGCYWGGPYEKFTLRDVDLANFSFPDDIDFRPECPEDDDYSPDDDMDEDDE